jgi:ectoine hydroxylase-related dioxygenase (phytanoyl-CoA dioxygenase family)
LENGEGNLLIKDNNDSVLTITPKEGEIIFFPGYLWHVPTHTPTSTIDRVVIAGNISSKFLLNTVLI